MKKFLSFAACIGCMLLSTTFSAYSTALSDGAIIYVGTAKMTHEDVNGWAPTGVNKAITYDETNHVLTLNEVAFTQPLDIDASAFWSDDFTIRIEGKTVNSTFEMHAKHAIRFRGGNGLIIEGDKGTGLSININNVGGVGGCGILCATSFSTSMAESDYLPLTIQGGVSVGVNNYGANESKYAAVIASPLTITSSDLSAVTTEGTGIDAVQTPKGIGGVSTTKSQWMNYDENDNYFWEWKAYAVAYDVWINGYALTDRRSSLTSSDMKNIKSGALNYDAEKNILELSGGFELETRDGWSNGILYSGSDKLTIKINSYSPVTISETSMSSSHAALSARAPIIIDLNGCDLNLTSTNGTGLLIEDEVMIINSMGIGTPSDAEKKKLTVSSPVGYGILGDASKAKLTIDRTNVVAGGNKGSVIEIPTTLNHVELESGYHWNSMNSVVDGSNNEANDPKNPVHFNISAWQLETIIWPEGAGKVTITDGISTVDNRYYFSNDKTVSMTAIPNAGWEFMMWADMNTYNPRDAYLPIYAGSVNYQADFVRLIESETQWYTIVEVGGKRSIYPLNNKLRELGSKIADLSPTDGRSIVCAAFADGNLYYIETNSLGTQSWLVKASFDGTALGSPQIITADANSADYSFFYNITYSSRDECFYAFCRRMSDAKDYFVKLSPADGTITEITSIAAGYSIDGLVVDENGMLYTFFNSDELYVLDPTIPMSDTKIGETDLYLPGTSSTAMFNDPSTGELFVFDDDIFWRVNKTNGTVEPVWLLSALNTNCIFSIATPTLKLSVKPFQKGTAHFTLSGGGETYTDEGVFDAGTEITITGSADGSFVFARWMDDSNWKDETLKIGETRTFTMPSKSVTLEAMYYYAASSSDEWYGVNDGKFISFRMDDHGAEVVKAASPSAANVKAGEFYDDVWYYLDNTTVKSMPFSGMEDGDNLEPDAEPVAKSVPSNVTDIAYDFSGRNIYAIADSKLLRVDFDEQKLVEIGTLEYKKASVSAVGIAINTSGTIYLLSAGDGTEGVLYIVSEIDEDGKKVILEVAGAEDKGGKIGTKVTNEAQSIAFDHASNELFWGAPDYIRIITTDDELKAYIAGDLGQKEGAQGVIKSMHKMDMEYTVRVQVDEDQEDYGTVSIGKGTSSVKRFMKGQKATIVATPKEGYAFVNWTKKGQTKEISDKASYSFTVQSNVTYVAHFKSTKQSIDETLVNSPSAKMLIDGQLFIIRGEKTYTVTGQEVK